MRKSTASLLLLAFLLMGVWVSIPRIAQAEVEWRILKDLDLQATPLDVAPSADGQRLFILTAGEILIYSFPEDRITDRIPAGKEFDRIAPLPRADALTLMSSSKKSLRVILLESVYKIDLTAHAFKGPQDAAVTVVVFTDYQ